MELNFLQLKASDPSESAWVSASAGTGKTKILTDRVIRLLLEGVNPAKILCLTFTNAAANEMHERIIKSLKELSELDSSLSRRLGSEEKRLGKLGEESANQHQLKDKIFSITGSDPSQGMINKARSLYQEYLTSEDKINIHTLHSYCQKILQKFPMEAGIPANFSILDEANRFEVINMIKNEILVDPKLYELNKFFAENFHQSTIDEILVSIINNKNYLYESAYGDISSSSSLLDYTTASSSEDSFSEFDNSVDNLSQLINDSSSVMYSKYQEILNYPLVRNLLQELASNDQDDFVREDDLSRNDIHYDESYVIKATKVTVTKLKELFLNKQGQKRSRVVSAKIAKKGSNLHDQILYLQEQVYWMDQADRKKQVESYSKLLQILGKYFLSIYDKYKLENGYLDYDDLIIKTKELLYNKSARDWVLYKLDGGIDHLLVDEAQDTSKNQWQIIEAMIQEFFSGDSNTEFADQNTDPNSKISSSSSSYYNAENLDRTLFVVGDQKQSIFSFQGADVSSFIDMNNRITAKLSSIGKIFNNIELDVSYRSAKEILELVHEVFKLFSLTCSQKCASEEIKKLTAVFSDMPYLSAHRNGHKGSVEFWPLYKKKAGEVKFWPVIADNLVETEVSQSSESDHSQESDYSHSFLEPKYKLAKDISEYIKNEIDSGKILDSTGKRISAGDFMILFRTRNELTNLVIQELSHLSIPVSGLDRIKLKEDILIQDIMAFAKYVINPKDDLNLCSLLKTPFFRKTDLEIADIISRSKGKRVCEVLDESLLNYVYKMRSSSVSDFFIKLINIFRIKDKLHLYYADISDVDFDSIRELLITVQNYQSRQDNSLQGFIIWFENNDIEIKRENSKISVVKIMTVHGSKGLQAPYVILCDTTSLPNSYNRIVIDESSGELISARSSEFTDESFKEIHDIHKQKEYQEYIRLLYVALTRAEDHLVVCGCIDKSSVSEDCWYSLIHPAIKNLVISDGDENILDKKTGVSDIDQEESQNYRKDDFLILYSSPKEDLQYDDIEIKELEDSSADIKHNSILSSANRLDSAEYGLIFHKILEDGVWLSDLESIKSHPLIEKLSDDNKARIKTSFDNILSNEEFKNLLKLEIKTEVSIGRPAIRSLADLDQFDIGRIDLIAIDHNQKTVSIVDYKSDKNPPSTSDLISLKYRNQLQFYKENIAEIYHGYKLNTYILWLHTGVMHSLQGE